ncbi:MAG: nucleotide sugar dehydrogenase [Microthrixaceae bacterium]
MRISVFGLGYVGTVSAACLARDGHSVIGVDPNRTKVDLINSGLSPIIETDIDDLIARTATSGHLRATDDVAEAVGATDMSLICVGTPSNPNGSLDLSFVERVCEQIGQALAANDGFHVVVNRSTTLPGTVHDVVIPTLEKSSGLAAGVDFGVCNNPEFLREGSAVYDFDNPPKTVIGEIDERSGDLLAEIYSHLDAPLIRVPVEVAEMVKYTDNVFHALKVSFANEIGNVCKELGVDSHVVMDIFCQDRKLNLSPYYLKPGFAFGGSCLPKDVRALSYKARSLDLDSPIIEGIMSSNQNQVERGIQMITAPGKRRIGILGFAFKAGTDDLRESPLVNVIETLIGKGYELKLYDRSVTMAALTGANKDYILNRIPHISRLMVDSISEVTDFAEVLVVGNGSPEFLPALESLRDDVHVVDLVRILADEAQPANYQGICW